MRSATVVGLLAVAGGVVVLGLMALAVSLAQPGTSLADGYWVGPLPWTALGVGLVVIGGTVALVSGSVTAWLAGGVARRVVAVVALAAGASWWVLAMIPPPRGAFCASCPAPTPDPITMAYSQPEAALLFLVLPAVVAAIAGLGARRTREPAQVATVPS